MCFSQSMSFGFSALGIGVSIYVYFKTQRIVLSGCVIFFVLMEILQGFQYFWIDECDNWINKFLTFIGFLHIALQPFFTHLMVYQVAKKEDKKIFKLIMKMCLCVTAFFIVRFFLGWYNIAVYDDISGFQIGYDEFGNKNGFDSKCGLSNEWLRGKSLCTFSGRKHLAWSVPMATSSYYIPSVFLHFFMMFVPFFVIEGYKSFWIQGIIFVLSGPILTNFFTNDLMEQPSIWCFLSIVQICVMLGVVIFIDNEERPWVIESKEALKEQMKLKLTQKKEK